MQNSQGGFWFEYGTSTGVLSAAGSGTRQRYSGLGPTDTAGTVQGPRWDVLSSSSRGSLAARLGKEAAPAAALGVPAALAAVVQVLAAGAGSAVAGRGGHTGAR